MQDKLTDDEAKAMLDRLTKVLREPVLPMSQYCAAFETWMHCVQGAHKKDPSGHGSSYAPLMGRIWTDVKKSSLLARLLYGGEKLRTRECPVHNGKWSGLGDCELGCDCTGWIPDPKTESAPA